MRKNVLYLVGLFAAASVLQSCIDKDYDLEDIDMTLSTGGDITLPTSSTGDIVLKNFMDLKEDGVVQFVSDGSGDSVFAVIKGGTADIAPVSINEVKFTPELSSIDPITVNLRELTSARPAHRKITVFVNLPYVGQQQVVIPDDKIQFHYDLNSGKAKYVIDETNSSSRSTISDDIISIKEVDFKDGTTLILNMTISGFFTWIPNATLSNLVLSLPEDLTVTKCTFMGEDAVSIAPGSIQLTNEAGMKIPTNGTDIRLELTLASVKEGRNFKFDASKHEVSFGGEFGVSGTFVVTADNIDEAELNNFLNNSVTAEDLQTIYSTQSLKCIMPESVTFRGYAHFSQQGIVLEKFQGQLQHEVGNIEPIQLNDLPDFLNDPDVVLDLYNPILLFKVRQEIPAPVSTDLTLTSSSTDDTKTLQINNIVIPSNQSTYYYAADKELSASEKAMLPDEYKNATRLQIASGTVGSLIEKIPEQIGVEVAPARVDASQTPVDITRSYDIDVDYQMFAPLTMGPKFKLIYRDSEHGWEEDLDDIEDLNMGSLELKAEAISNLPTDMTLRLIPIDRDGNKIEQLDVNDIRVSSSPDGREKSTNITFAIKGKNGKTLNDALAGKNGVKRLDGIIYEAILDNAVAGMTMRKNAKIVLRNIKLTIKGGITYDANDND